MNVRLHHVQVSCPPGGEAAARSFYSGVLGLPEVAKPPALAARGGMWLGDADVEVHVGVEEPFTPARKAHPAFLVDEVEAVATAATAKGFPVIWDDNFRGYRRFYTADGNGNRVEILSRLR